MAEKAEERKPRVYESPLAVWPGSITLPHPDEYSRLHWDTWRNGIEKPLRQSYSFMHMYAYSGLEFLKAYDGWGLEIPLEDVQAWERNPEDERVKLIAWLGRTLQDYMREIIDPKG